MFHTSSIWLTLALAVQRYIYVCHAPLARKFCTMENVYKCLGYILFVAVFHQTGRCFEVKYTPVSTCYKTEQKMSQNLMVAIN